VQNHPLPKLTYEDALSGLATGNGGNLRYTTKQIPLLSVGYLFRRGMRKIKGLGFYGGLELNSAYWEKQVKRDAGFYEYYSWWGIYSYTGIEARTVFTCYLNADLHYHVNKFVFASGISSVLVEQEFNNAYMNDAVFFYDRLLYLRVAYDFTESFSVYLNVRTFLYTEYYSRPF